MNASSREAALAALLARAGFAGAERVALPGDASTRRYERLNLRGRRAILMDAPRSAEAGPCPPGASPAERRAMGWNATARLAASRVEAFVAVGEHLRGLGLSAPEVFGVDYEAGYAVLEDLGDQLFVRAIAEGAEEEALYAAAGELLFCLHAAPTPDVLSAHGAAWPILDYDALALEAGADLPRPWRPACTAYRRRRRRLRNVRPGRASSAHSCRCA